MAQLSGACSGIAGGGDADPRMVDNLPRVEECTCVEPEFAEASSLNDILFCKICKGYKHIDEEMRIKAIKQWHREEADIGLL